MRIEKTIQLPAWDEQTRQKVISFWQNRGVVFTGMSDRCLKGQRGSLFNNMICFDMGKLSTELTVLVSETNQCTCILDVNTLFQKITSWNKQHWPLELDTFESFILYNDAKEQEWAEYRSKSQNSDLTLIITIFVVCAVVGFGAGVVGGMFAAIRALLLHK